MTSKILPDASQKNAAILNQKLDRIHEYLQQSLQETDLRRMILGIASSDTVDLTVRLKQVIDEVLASEVDWVTELDTIAPVIELYLKASRQADRYLQLDQRLLFDNKSSNPR